MFRKLIMVALILAFTSPALAQNKPGGIDWDEIRARKQKKLQEQGSGLGQTMDSSDSGSHLGTQPSNKPAARSNIPLGAKPFTSNNGTLFVPSGNGFINTRNGQFYPNDALGQPYDPQTGQPIR